jgi:dTMP kinase
MPVFVVSIDGPDFSGKTTISNLVLEYLRPVLKNNGIEIKKTELPSTMITGYITKILRNSADNVSQEVFSLAYAIDHLYHYEKFIKPLEKSDKKFVVIQERSLLTTLIYQGLIGKVDLNWIRNINKFDKNIPNLTIILKVLEEELMKRKFAESISREADKFEDIEFLKKEINVYYNLPKNLEKEFNVKYVEANEEANLVARKCAKLIEDEVKKFYKIGGWVNLGNF